MLLMSYDGFMRFFDSSFRQAAFAYDADVLALSRKVPYTRSQPGINHPEGVCDQTTGVREEACACKGQKYDGSAARLECMGHPIFVQSLHIDLRYSLPDAAQFIPPTCSAEIDSRDARYTIVAGVSVLFTRLVKMRHCTRSFHGTASPNRFRPRLSHATLPHNRLEQPVSSLA